ncbi:MAG TPA: hypothetical protein PL079_03615 [Tenuifilaceae bacterium]|nr:hypothetical protein [Bacteroidales bacterium]HOC36293.1 hypothetical protein [Tenuifilaceae bacterium]HQM04982.1 hypothetical protein [Tenuifilaceae bacterium]HQN83463.1 hypothetical protein [Tenuifilaceae bacterium]
MLTIPNLFLVGGNSRHSGKTTLACEIIRRLAKEQEVTAIKFIRFDPDEKEMHGSHLGESEFSGYSIMRETNNHSSKDTSQMLQAGAKEVFYIRSGEEFMEQASIDFLTRYNHGQPLVCESSALRHFVEPAVFVMMMRIPPIGNPKSVESYLPLADRILYFDKSYDERLRMLEELQFDSGKFYLPSFK